MRRCYEYGIVGGAFVAADIVGGGVFGGIALAGESGDAGVLCGGGGVGFRGVEG